MNNKKPEYLELWDSKKPIESARRIVDAGIPVAIYYYDNKYVIRVEPNGQEIMTFKTLREAELFSRRKVE